MILDTNALSAWADGNAGIEPHVRGAARLVIPAVVVGEFEFGIRQSRYRREYEAWLEETLSHGECAGIDRATAACYAEVRLALKAIGRSIPVNDTWIAAVARQLALPVLSQDAHFDAVKGLQRIAW